MRRRKTLGELRWPSRPEIDAVRHAWTADAVDRLLGFVWQGYDRLLAEVLGHIDIGQAEDDLERSLTQALESRINRSMIGPEPFFVQHGRYEHISRKVAPAQPPQYDLAFVLYSNENVCWPFEAKVLKHDTDVGAYITDVRAEFLKGRYAPLSAEGAMIGYLLEGTTINVFAAIAAGLTCELSGHPKFSERAHRISNHTRETPGESLARPFTCHHLLMPLRGPQTQSD